jgi:hypothetical protein
MAHDFEGPRLLLLRHCSVIASAMVAIRDGRRAGYAVRPSADAKRVRKVRITDPAPYAQHHCAVHVVYVPIRRRNPRMFVVVPTSIEYVTLERDGKVLYDSRDDVPCDMAYWQATRTKWERHWATA